MRGNTILITGANGFIGSHMVKRLLKEDCNVVALIRDPNLVAELENQSIKPIMGDILDKNSLHQIPQCDGVFHLAGILDHTKGEDYMMNVNYEGSVNILEFCKQRKIKKLIHLSSLGVMACSSPLIDLNEDDPIPDKPIGIYARSKASAEKALVNSNTDDINISIVRPPFVWGSGDRYSLPKLIESINKKIFSWVDNGNYPFATCHVENLVEGLCKAYLYGKNKNVYYIKDKELTTIKDFLTPLILSRGISVPQRTTSRKTVNMICNIIESPWKIFPLRSNPPTHLRETMILMGPTTIRSDKAEKELNYFPVMDRKTGMEGMTK